MKKFILIAFALMLALALAAPVAADTPSEDKSIQTEVTIGSNGGVPSVCAKWETPDMVDFDPDTGAPVPGMQLVPTAHGVTTFKVYAVVGGINVNEITGVDASIYYANDDLKFELRGSRNGTGGWDGVRTWPNGDSDVINVREVPYDSNPATGIDMDGDCTPETTVDAAIDALDLAGQRIWYGLDDQGNPMNSVSLKSELGLGKQIIIELTGDMHFHQPAERYKVGVVALGDGTISTELMNYFDYTSIVSLLVDFDTAGVNYEMSDGVGWCMGDGGQQDLLNEFGQIVAGGDGIPDSMQTPNRPTVWNVGNDPAMLEVTFTRLVMVGPEPDPSKWIEEFDCALGDGMDAYVNHPIMADTPTVIVDEIGEPVLLESCHPTQIDFSVHPPINTQPGTYQGDVLLKILHWTL